MDQDGIYKWSGILYQNCICIFPWITHESLRKMKEIDSTVTEICLPRHLYEFLMLRKTRNLENAHQCILSLHYSCSIDTPFVFRFHPQISGEFLDCLRMSMTQRIESKNVSSADGVSRASIKCIGICTQGLYQ
jgi:hypothetical protein